MSDGASVYECTSDDQVIDLVQGGQGVFGIALGKVWRELEGSLATLPSDRGHEQPTIDVVDELAQLQGQEGHRQLVSGARAAAASGRPARAHFLRRVAAPGSNVLHLRRLRALGKLAR